MVLGFHKQFVPMIKKGQKIHTIRRGSRWRKGRIVHFATGVRTKNYNQFRLGECDGVERVNITYWEGDLIIVVGENTLTLVERLELAEKDGFDAYHDFVKWFYDATGKGREIFRGQIVHWTKFRYT